MNQVKEVIWNYETVNWNKRRNAESDICKKTFYTGFFTELNEDRLHEAENLWKSVTIELY